MQTTLSQHAINKDYKAATRKRFVHLDIHRNLQQHVQLSRVVGLMGNNAMTYVQFLQSVGFKQVALYEVCKEVYNRQVKTLSTLSNVTAFNYSVVKAYKTTKTYYDLDFCATIQKDYIKQIVSGNYKYYAVTVSFDRHARNKNSFYSTIDTFLSAKGEKRIGRGFVKMLYKLDNFTGERFNDGNRNNNIRVFEFKSDKNTYKIYIYKDTSPMYVITPAI